MPEYFADTSAVLKLYFNESGSAWLSTLDLSSLTLSGLTIPEVASAIARRRGEGLLSDGDARLTWRKFRQDVQAWLLVDVARALLIRAAGLLIRSSTGVPLRALDAIQLASALEAQRQYRQAGVGSLTFLTADSRLELAARRAGLDVDNPERHSV